MAMTVMLLNMNGLLLDVHWYANLNGLLDNDFLEDGNLHWYGDRLRYMDNLMYGNWDVLGYLYWYGNLLVNGNRHMLIDGHWYVLVNRYVYWDRNNMRNRVRLRHMDNFRNVHDLRDLLDDGNLHRYWERFWHVHDMGHWHKFVHWVWLRDRHRLRYWDYLVDILDNLMHMPMMPAVVAGIGDGK